MTNGIVSITRNGKTVFKVVAGCDGYNAPKLAQAIRETGPSTLDQVYDLALDCDFGCKECLVVIGECGERYEGDEPLGPLYRSTFADPRFNPRWERGTAAYVEVIEIGEQAPAFSVVVTESDTEVD